MQDQAAETQADAKPGQSASPPIRLRKAVHLGCALLLVYCIGTSITSRQPWKSPPTLPHLPTLIGGAAFSTAFAQTLIQLIAELTSPKAGILFIEATIYSMAACSYTCCYLARSPNPSPPVQVYLSLATSSPLVLTLLSIASISSRLTLILTILATQAALLCSFVLSTLGAPAAPPLSALYITLLLFVFLLLITPMLANLHRQKPPFNCEVNSTGVLVGVYAVLVATAVLGALLLLLPMGLRTSVVSFAGIAVDVLLRMLLPRVLHVANFLLVQARPLQAKECDVVPSSRPVVDVPSISMRMDSFMSSMSHELRTPLNGIIALTEGLLKDSCGPLTDAMRRSLHTIRMSALRLLSMLDNIMETSVPPGALTHLKESVNLRATCQDVANLRKQTRSKVAIRNDIPKDCIAAANGARVIQIFNTLLGNVTKCLTDGEVCVSAERFGDFWHVSFSDTSSHTPPAMRKTVFDVFEQEESSAEWRQSSLGAGLNAVRELVAAHGGKITVKSKKTVGTVFTFTVPVAPDATAATAAEQPAEGDGLSSCPTSPRASSPGSPDSPPPPGLVEGPTKRPLDIKFPVPAVASASGTPMLTSWIMTEWGHHRPLASTSLSSLDSIVPPKASRPSVSQPAPVAANLSVDVPDKQGASLGSSVASRFKFCVHLPSHLREHTLAPNPSQAATAVCAIDVAHPVLRSEELQRLRINPSMPTSAIASQNTADWPSF